MSAIWVQFPVEVRFPIFSHCQVNSVFHPSEVGKGVPDNTGANSRLSMIRVACHFLLTKNLTGFVFFFLYYKKLRQMRQRPLFNDTCDKKICVPVAIIVLLGCLLLIQQFLRVFKILSFSREEKLFSMMRLAKIHMNH